MNVAGLNDNQLANARVMVAEVKRLGLPQRAAVVMVETAIVESQIQIMANWNVPESLAIPHEDTGADHASVGVLQQQVPSWGSTRDCMDPVMSCRKFLFGGGNNPGLLNLPGYRFDFVGYSSATNWTQIPTGAAAQAVQVSAFPGRYQELEAEATSIVQAVWGLGGTIGVDDMTPAESQQLHDLHNRLAKIDLEAFNIDGGNGVESLRTVVGKMRQEIQSIHNGLDAIKTKLGV